jgi:flagellar protein FliJ
MSFRFRLATLLKLREQTRDERRRDLAQAFEAERILREQLAALKTELTDNQELLRGMSISSEIQVDQLSHARRFEAILKMQVTHVLGQMEQVTQEVERRRTALLEADREVKALLKLEERQLHVHEKKQDVLESKQIEEAALRGFRLNHEAHT